MPVHSAICRYCTAATICTHASWCHGVLALIHNITIHILQHHGSCSAGSSVLLQILSAVRIGHLLFRMLAIHLCVYDRHVGLCFDCLVNVSIYKHMYKNHTYDCSVHKAIGNSFTALAEKQSASMFCNHLVGHGLQRAPWKS